MVRSGIVVLSLCVYSHYWFTDDTATTGRWQPPSSEATHVEACGGGGYGSLDTTVVGSGK